MDSEACQVAKVEAVALLRVVAALSRLGSGGGGVEEEEREAAALSAGPQSVNPSRHASMAVSGGCS